VINTVVVTRYCWMMVHRASFQCKRECSGGRALNTNVDVEEVVRDICVDEASNAQPSDRYAHHLRRTMLVHPVSQERETDAGTSGRKRIRKGQPRSLDAEIFDLL